MTAPLLALYGHPFSSYTQKVLVALYENGTPFEFRCISPDHPGNVAEWLERWPLRKFPVLLDGGRQVVETSVIIEYLQRARFCHELQIVNGLRPGEITRALAGEDVGTIVFKE